MTRPPIVSRARSAATLLALLLFGPGCGQDTGMGPEPPRDPGAASPKPSGAPKATPPAVRVGLDMLEEQRAPNLKGKKVGLLAHGASVTADGRYAVDVLRSLDVEVVKLFSPEHGLRGEAAAGEKVASGTDKPTGLPVISLYGSQTRPKPEDLAGLDALVVDLQDVGVRFYTYAGTLILTMMEAPPDLEIVVLDRPNPLGGERIEGPVSEAASTAPKSLLDATPGPLVHGLTIGEIAQLVNARRPKPGKVTVVPMTGWKRSMTWADTGRKWVNPSPNLRSAEAAMVYPGVALLEATNVSEGRGTETPFQILGAPWLKPEGVIPKLAATGLTLETAAFTPRTAPAAPDPKYKDQPCAGIRVGLSDASRVSPYRLGVSLLHALRSQEGFAWRDGGAALDQLVGTRKLRAALEKGDAVDAIVAADLADIEAFKKERQKHLLY